MATKEVYIPGIIAMVVLEAEDGSTVAHCIVDDDFPSEFDAIDDFSELPAQLLRDGRPPHEKFGKSARTAKKNTVVKLPIEVKPEDVDPLVILEK